MTGKPRIALVTNVLAHYRVPCFQALAECLPGQVDFYLLSAGMPSRQYVLADENLGLPVHTLRGLAWSRPPLDDLHLNDPRPALRGYDLIVLGGWAEPTYMLLWLLSLATHKRAAFWVESTLQDAPRGRWRESLKRLMLERAAGVIVPGTSAAAYCRSLGMPEHRIFTAPNSINTSYFRERARALVPQRTVIRAELGFTGVVVLFAGRMVERFKSVSTLLSAYAKARALVPPETGGLNLVLVGEGEDRAAYECQAADAGGNGIRFVDFLPHDELCRYYAAADMFVLPSRSEPWGFVLNEAMEFSLPLVVGRAVGSAADLVRDEENGLTVSSGDTETLAAALTRLACNPGLRARMGAASKARIAGYTPDRWAEGFARAAQAMTDGGGI